MSDSKYPSGVTKKQLQAYVLISGEHQGMTTKQAARIMGISSRAVVSLLKRMEKIMPDLFPLLTKDEASVRLHYLFDGTKPDFNTKKMENLRASLYKKGQLPKLTPAKTVAYSPNMDSQVIQKF